MTEEREQSPDKVDILRQKLYWKAKNEPRFRFYSLYSHVYRVDVLKEAWARVKSNGGSAGLDGITIKDIKESGEDEFLRELGESLRTREYKPQAVKRVYIPKANGGKRPLGIPTVRDRVVQAAVKLIIEPIFEADFSESSHGFRPGRSQHDALRAIEKALKEGKQEVYDIDMQGYFDSIPHDKLMKCVEMRISDGKVLKLIRMWLKVAVVEEDDEGKKHSKRSKTGTPQGGVISPLLSNIYLHWFDKVFNGKDGPAQRCGATLVRYADDMLILASCLTDEIKDFTSDKLETWLGLKLNQEKSKVVTLAEGKESVDFLGFTCRLDRDLKGRPWRYVNIFPSAKALKRERARIKDMTASSHCFKPIPALIKEINSHLESWTPYYNFGYPRKAFRSVDEYVRRRLVIHLKRRSQRPFRPSPGVSWYHQLEQLGYIRI